MTFPANVLNLLDAAGSNFLNVAWGGATAMSTGLNLIKSNLIATQKRLGTGSQTAPARGLALIGQGVADGDGNQQSIWDRVERKNRLRNGSMRQSLRTISGMPTADNAYSLDCWRLLLGAANAATISQDTSSTPSGGSRANATLIVGSGNNNPFGIFQPILAADMWDLRGQTVSLQLSLIATAGLTDIRAAVLAWTGTADAISGDPINNGTTSWVSATSPTLTTNWAFANASPANLNPTTSWATYYIENIAIPSNATNLGVLIWCADTTTTTTTDFFRVTDVQLEKGAVCTNAERLPEPAEAEPCRDWVQLLEANSTSGRMGTGVCSANNAGEVILPLPHRMRAAPAASYAAASKYQVYDGVSVTALSSISTNSPTKSAHSITWGVAGTPYAATRSIELLGVDSGTYILLSAEP